MLPNKRAFPVPRKGYLVFQAFRNARPIYKQPRELPVKVFTLYHWRRSSPCPIQYSNIVQYNTVQYSKIQYITVQYSTVQ